MVCDGNNEVENIYIQHLESSNWFRDEQKNTIHQLAVSSVLNVRHRNIAMPEYVIVGLHILLTAVGTFIELIHAAGSRANGSVAKSHMWLSTAQGSMMTMHRILDQENH